MVGEQVQHEYAKIHRFPVVFDVGLGEQHVHVIFFMVRVTGIRNSSIIKVVTIIFACRPTTPSVVAGPFF